VLLARRVSGRVGRVVDSAQEDTQAPPKISIDHSAPVIRRSLSAREEKREEKTWP
jgi:hypothetical protein